MAATDACSRLQSKLWCLSTWGKNCTASVHMSDHMHFCARTGGHFNSRSNSFVDRTQLRWYLQRYVAGRRATAHTKLTSWSVQVIMF
jgi:hypothetical protein